MGKDRLPPYRVEWRPNLVTSWILLNHYDKREDADAAAVDAMKQWKGYCRLITQHVIERNTKQGEWTCAI